MKPLKKSMPIDYRMNKLKADGKNVLAKRVCVNNYAKIV